MPLLTLLFQEPITIDRIEGNQAIIEWDDLSISSLPIALFPNPPKEGEQFMLMGEYSEQGSCTVEHDDPVILQCPDKILYLPIDISWTISQNKSIKINFSLSL